MLRTRAICFLFSCLMLGCRGTTSEAFGCPDALRNALVVLIKDASTGRAFPFRDVHVLAISGAYRDSAYTAAFDGPTTLADPLFGFGLALRHPGTFTVKVSAAGYEDWERAGIVTSNNLRCAFYNDTVVAGLVPVRR